MMKDFILAVFDDEEDLVKAAQKTDEMDIPIYDVYTPFPVHGLDDLLKIKRSRLPIICFIGGAVGLVVALGFQTWISKVAWPIIVGGKSMASTPAYIPVTFEVTVLLATFLTVFAFLGRSQLIPGKRAKIIYPGVTDNKFVMALDKNNIRYDVAKMAEIYKEFGAVAVQESNDNDLSNEYIFHTERN